MAVVCTLCHTRLHVAQEHVGGQLVCPDCGTRNVIPPPPPPRRAIDVMAGAGGGYRVSERASPPAAAVPQHAPVQSGRQLEPHSQRPALPRHPFLAGTWTFPFVRAWGNAARMAVWVLICIGLASAAGSFILKGHPIAVVVGALFGAAAVFLLFGLLAFAAGCAIAILRDTANGCDEIQEWPSIAFFEWMTEPLYIVSAIFVSLVPGVALRWLPDDYRGADFIVMPVSLFVLFPLVLVAMLENGTPAGVVSWPVCRSLWRAWKGWISFYFMSGLVVVAAAGLAIAARWVGPSCEIPAVPVIVVLVWLIYFRLLGRLAWYCAEKDRAAEVDDDDSDDARPED